MFINRKNLVSVSSLGCKKIVKQMKKSRSNRPEVYCKKGVLKSFAKLTGKHQHAGISFYQSFLVNFMKSLRTPTPFF